MNTTNSAQLKHLQTMRTEAVAEIQVAREEQRAASDKVTKLQARINSLDQQIRDLTTRAPDPIVSEHALLRYFERVEGYDLEAIKKKILPEPVAQQIKTIRSGTFPVGNNGSSFRLRVKDHVVITILTPEEKE